VTDTNRQSRIDNQHPFDNHESQITNALITNHAVGDTPQRAAAVARD
jgi:hypothetical protein